MCYTYYCFIHSLNIYWTSIIYYALWNIISAFQWERQTGRNCAQRWVLCQRRILGPTVSTGKNLAQPWESFSEDVSSGMKKAEWVSYVGISGNISGIRYIHRNEKDQCRIGYHQIDHMAVICSKGAECRAVSYVEGKFCWSYHTFLKELDFILLYRQKIVSTFSVKYKSKKFRLCGLYCLCPNYLMPPL